MKLQKNWLEWSVFAVGLVLVLGTLGYLSYDALTMGSEPPVIEIRLEPAVERAGNYIIPVSIKNNGDQTAEGIHVEVQLIQQGRELERSEFVVAFLPRKATREGWVTFKTNPATAEQITARVLGYEKP